jgi:hypothetical protein
LVEIQEEVTSYIQAVEQVRRAHDPIVATK